MFIDSEKCVGCGHCLPFCPNEAISVFGTAFINKKCKKCKICIAFCPNDAIGD